MHIFKAEETNFGRDSSKDWEVIYNLKLVNIDGLMFGRLKLIFVAILFQSLHSVPVCRIFVRSAVFELTLVIETNGVVADHRESHDLYRVLLAHDKHALFLGPWSQLVYNHQKKAGVLLVFPVEVTALSQCH